MNKTNNDWQLPHKWSAKNRIYRFNSYGRPVLMGSVFSWLLMTSIVLGDEPCRLRVIDAANGWPVPLVELRTTHHVRLVTDNSGQIAFDLSELMNVETWFHLEGHGYTVDPDGFGMVGIRLIPRPGTTHTIKVKRTQLAKRLGRITGGGIFAESQQLGDDLDWTEQGILGCDSVQTARHRGKLFWGWGDTVLPRYPLGRFHMIGATTGTQPLSALQPPIRLRYDYFTDSQRIPRNVAQMPGDGPTWLSGYASLPDRDGNDRLVATYSKIDPPLTEYERGLCVWSEEHQRFEKLQTLWSRSDGSSKPRTAPTGHAVFEQDHQGTRWVYFGDPFPQLKCKATFEDWSQPKRWQRLSPQPYVVSKDENKQVKPHRGAIAWNDFRDRWVTVFTQFHGEASTLGELWYAEADQPSGPWADAIPIVTHNKYTFYNPQLHADWVSQGSPVLLFEATYTHTFSKTHSPTPRHDYNQVLYRLDLDELTNAN